MNDLSLPFKHIHHTSMEGSNKLFTALRAMSIISATTNVAILAPTQKASTPERWGQVLWAHL